ncbi:DNA cytosine methyltransferase [Glaesserella parasuis]|nr:DNA cytosine methyltransferase [Glaesserella parasuis]
MFTYGSICSGIEAVSVAWEEIGKPLWFSEIEPFPCAVLAHHYPNVPNLGDMTALPQKILNREIPAPDVLVGGTPCQAFSVAGKRESLEDERGNLTLTLIHILETIDYVRQQDGQQPCVLVWENVPGVLSTKDNAFGHFFGWTGSRVSAITTTKGKMDGRWLCAFSENSLLANARCSTLRCCPTS